MTVLPFLAFTVGAGLVAWFGRAWPRAAIAVGLTGLLGALILVVGLPDQVDMVAGGEAVSGGSYLRLFVAAACLGGIGFSVTILTAAGDAERDRLSALPAGFLLFAGGAALTLALPGPFASLLAGSGAGLAAFAVVGRVGTVDEWDADPAEVPDAAAGARALSLELLRVGLAASIAIVVTAALAGDADVLGGVPFGVGLADLALAFAVGLRLGVIPLHGVAARLGESSFRGPSVLLLVWGPAIFAAAALGAAQAGVVPLGLPLPTERGLIVGAGVLGIVLGGVAAVVQDDIERAVVYSIAQDAGFAVVAFAGTDAEVWGPARAWLLIFALTKTAFLAWAVAMSITFGTQSLDELRGWVRRAPLLAVTLVVVALATVGVPGMAAFEVRSELLSAVLSDPVRLAIAIASFGGLLVYGRLLLVGIAKPSVVVLAAPDERLRRSFTDAIEPTTSTRRRRTSAAAAAGDVIAVNRTPISAAMAVALAVTALVFGAGLFGLRSSASMYVPPPLPAGQLGPPPGPTFRPVPTEPPPTASPSSPAPSDSTAPSPAGS